MSYLLVQADARRLPIPDRSVNAIVTSPPYFSQRDYQVPNQIGLETTPDLYVAAIVLAFSEAWRVLADDGTVYLNCGDTFLNGKGCAHGTDPKNIHSRRFGVRPTDKQIPGLKHKDLIGVPYRLAFALQNAGWYWRQLIVWHKSNGMVEAVQDRPTTASETVLLLSKRPTYFYDWYGCATPSPSPVATELPDGFRMLSRLRNVWSIPVKGWKGAHFATMPEALAGRCVRLATSDGGRCRACNLQWRRRVTAKRFPTRPGDGSKVVGKTSRQLVSRDVNHPGEANGKVVGNRDPRRHVTAYRFDGWTPSCRCGGEPEPCLVMDNFNGSGTTGLESARLGRSYIGTDLSRDYLKMAADRIARGLRPVSRLDAKPAFRPADGQNTLFDLDGDS